MNEVSLPPGDRSKRLATRATVLSLSSVAPMALSLGAKA